MFCPQCGSSPADGLNFCNSCGANLKAVRQALTAGPQPNDDGISLGQTWLATMFLTGPERRAREEELERRRGITLEHKGARNIKNGTVTASVGLALTIVVFVIMQGIVSSADLNPVAVAILSRVWVAGLIPILVGIGLILNGLGSKRWLANPALKGAENGSPDRQAEWQDRQDRALAGPPDSVTEATTRNLEAPPVNR